jgi:hypothetical protein
MPLGRKPNSAALIAFGALFIIFAFGTTLRYQAFARSVVPDYPHGDAAKYFLYAYNLTNFGIYGYGELAVLPADTDKAVAREAIEPDTQYTPGYPLYLSLFLGGEYTKSQSDAARLGQVLMSSLTILLAYAAFAPFGRLYGLGVALLTAMSPHLINMNLYLLTETLFCFFLMAFVWVISRVKANSRLLLFLLMGLLLALATLTRPWIQAYLLVIVGYLFFSKLRFSVIQMLCVLVGAAIVITPWMVRNMNVIDDPASPGQVVTSIHHGMYPDMMFEEQSDTLGYAYRADPKSPMLEKSMGVTLAEVLRRAEAEPYKYAKWYLVGKIKTVLSWKIIAGADAIFVYQVGGSPYFEVPRFYLSAYYMEKTHDILTLLALIGVLIVWLPRKLLQESKERIFFLRSMSLLILYFLSVHMVLAPYPRYSIPMRPIIYAMALYPLVLVVGISGIKEKLMDAGRRAISRTRF